MVKVASLKRAANHFLLEWFDLFLLELSPFEKEQSNFTIME